MFKKLTNNLKKLKIYYQKEGFFVLLIHLSNFFIFLTLKKLSFIKTPHHRLIIYLNNKIKNISKNKIISGPYKSVKFINSVQINAGFKDYSSKFIGVYELQIQNLITDLQKKKKLENIINIGAGDGYHIISLIKNNFFKRGIAFEIEPKNRLILKKNLIINKVQKKITVLGEGNFATIKEAALKNKTNLNKTLFLIDIEGGEFTLFDEDNIKYFKNSILIIEDHSMLMKENFLNIRKFFNLINKNFNVKIINNMNRDPYGISELKNFSDDERWLMMSEGRGLQMRWIMLSPK